MINQLDSGMYHVYVYQETHKKDERIAIKKINKKKD